MKYEKIDSRKKNKLKYKATILNVSVDTKLKHTRNYLPIKLKSVDNRILEYSYKEFNNIFRLLCVALIKKWNMTWTSCASRLQGVPSM